MISKMLRKVRASPCNLFCLGQRYILKYSVVRRGSGIETSVLSYDGTSILPDATGLPRLSQMLAQTVRVHVTRSDRTWPMPHLLFLENLCSKHFVFNFN